jgi:hypothetical protein
MRKLMRATCLVGFAVSVTVVAASASGAAADTPRERIRPHVASAGHAPAVASSPSLDGLRASKHGHFEDTTGWG